MFCANKNSYLQLVCAMNPRVINKAVDMAMEKKSFDPRTEIPAAKRLESMQPSLYAPHVDITRANLGFGRIGLKLLIRQLHSEDYLVQLQAVHTVMDQVQISENALFLLSHHIVYRLADLMSHENPVIREKLCLIFTYFANYFQGRKQILSRLDVLDNLMWLTMRDRREIRYAAASTLKSISYDTCAGEVLLKVDKIIENILKMIKNEHVGIVIIHLKTLENLTEWDQEGPLKQNAFQVMLKLLEHDDTRIKCGAMDCLTQLCKHYIGKTLADMNDVTFLLRPFLTSESIEERLSAVALLQYTTVTTRSKWRAKEICNELTKNLVHLCHRPNSPLLQLRAMQVLINLCDCPDIRNHMKVHWETRIKEVNVRSFEEWDGTSETTSPGFEAGHNYRTICIGGIESIRNDGHSNAEINVYSYLNSVHKSKGRLLYAINWKSYKN